MLRKFVFALLSVSTAVSANAQDDLLDLLGAEETGPLYSTASFKTTRVINGQSIENVGHGVLDFKIGHRFGTLEEGITNFFGLDQSSVRIGFDYGVTDRLMIGVGRSGYQKTVDGFAKYKILRQCEEGCGMPITASFVLGSSVTTLVAQEVPWYAPGQEDHFSHRLSYNMQLVIGRKFSEGISLQITPGVIHRNLTTYSDDKNDVINIGIGGRVKLSKRVAFSAEYFYVLPDQMHEYSAAQLNANPNLKPTNSLSVGFDIETGGHVFQLHFTNSTGMFERAFITETTNHWDKREIHYGFNISRVFTLHTPKKKS
ncbi:MAG: hypothetical protein IPI00_17445 [Flavobacteriales bacterium]|nr:hypothetical protein [Flavobacteriales bacterium]MBK6945798.1 hypothetical protein [Flavobacteriales bacterium]MBK7241898.1 hypothetical protein [Flavobacteriales bacterium]MBK7298776.1 hypothetical protein [Flavobacteriales bacterium]MBK9534651.1 hypothetical protein [Flavobacteriales bacterium]